MEQVSSKASSIVQEKADSREFTELLVPSQEGSRAAKVYLYRFQSALLVLTYLPPAIFEADVESYERMVRERWMLTDLPVGNPVQGNRVCKSDFKYLTTLYKFKAAWNSARSCSGIHIRTPQSSVICIGVLESVNFRFYSCNNPNEYYWIIQGFLYCIVLY